MASTASKFTIGRLASEADCSVPTVRYYEEIGLLPKAVRGSGGQRVYGLDDLKRLTFIRRCRDFQFTVEQIREFTALADDPTRDCDVARLLAEQHLAVVREKMSELRKLEDDLTFFTQQCASQCSGGPAEKCVIMSDLSAPNCCA
ncbi:MerR family transcriptional regulator [Tardiphaga alba]|uniref:MerR family transcriptional regulator n=1 Tax=Tardiphaga alba TaxID=340268 RepID=A0ABX8A2R9_9BRAD|nr:helix-turn-helix domain-containing protein [Tardiphaga alba]QUS37839.1 MerR family transcriptional regulator [Tardiphaga alba]